MARPGRRNRGQFLILISLGIVIVMVALASVLAYTALSPIHFPKTNFRETVTQLSLNFRQASALALADVSKELDRKASQFKEVNQYLEHAKIDKDEKHPAKDKGYETLTEWQKITLLRQSGLGLNLTISKPDFQCDWGSSQGCSKAEANMTLDILSYGFYGWKNKVNVELNLTILSLKDYNESVTSFSFNLKREMDAPVSGLVPSSVKVFFQGKYNVFNATDPASIKLAYFGEGNYLLTCDTRNATYPIIKMILQDPSGIVVGAYSPLTKEDDTTGPKTTITGVSKVHPLPSGTKVITVNATINDFLTGLHNIVAAEYFIGAPRANGNGTSMYPIPPEKFNDWPQVHVQAQIDVTDWQPGNYIIYVHGKDVKDNWGDFTSATLKVTEIPKMHVKSIQMSPEYDPWNPRRIRAVVVVTIVDSKGNPVDDAVVYGQWSGATTKPTNPLGKTWKGRVIFRSGYVWGGGKFTFTVLDVTKEDWVYDASANEVPGPPYSVTRTFYTR